MTPITILAVQENGQFNQKTGQRQIALLTKQMYDMQGVVRVRSIAEPLGDPPGFFQPFSAEGRRKLAAMRTSADKGDLSDPSS